MIWFAGLMVAISGIWLLLMGAAWAINLAVAEGAIRRKRRPQSRIAPRTEGSDFVDRHLAGPEDWFGRGRRVDLKADVIGAAELSAQSFIDLPLAWTLRVTP